MLGLQARDLAGMIAEASALGTAHGWREANKAAQEILKRLQEQLANAGAVNAINPSMMVQVGGDPGSDFHVAAIGFAFRFKCGHRAKMVYEENPVGMDGNKIKRVSMSMLEGAAGDSCALCQANAEGEAKGTDA